MAKKNVYDACIADYESQLADRHSKLDAWEKEVEECRAELDSINPDESVTSEDYAKALAKIAELNNRIEFLEMKTSKYHNDNSKALAFYEAVQGIQKTARDNTVSELQKLFAKIDELAIAYRETLNGGMDLLRKYTNDIAPIEKDNGTTVSDKDTVAIDKGLNPYINGSMKNAVWGEIMNKSWNGSEWA